MRISNLMAEPKEARRQAILKGTAVLAIAAACAGWADEGRAAQVFNLLSVPSNDSPWTESQWFPEVPLNKPGDIIISYAPNDRRMVLDADVTIGQFHSASAITLNSNGTNTLTMKNTGGDNNPLGSASAFLGATGAGNIRVNTGIVLAGDLDIATTSTGQFQMQTGGSTSGAGNIGLKSSGSGNITLRDLNHAGQLIIDYCINNATISASSAGECTDAP